MAYATIVGIEVVYAIATLILVSLGLAIIFGMMRVINLAHGEFLVMGGYAATLAVHHGINVWIAILIVPPIVVGIIGLVVERAVIRFLYGRMVETMLASWGLSLLIVGILTTIFGSSTEGVPMALKGFTVGAYQASGYNIFVIVFSLLTVGAVYVLLRFTRLGLLARGTMQNAAMAAALGVDTTKVYAVTFALGAALAGLAGGVLAPVAGIVPTSGGSYIGQAFITVLGGGAAALTGVTSVALLLAAVVLIRILPNGITGRYFKGWL
jgi:branched-subunit amino acid ABC-type transport system permease component